MEVQQRGYESGRGLESKSASRDEGEMGFLILIAMEMESDNGLCCVLETVLVTYS